MQQRFPLMKLGFSRIVLVVLALSIALLSSACGGGSSSSNTASAAASLTATPTSISLNHGQVVQITNVKALDSTGASVVLPGTVTYSSDNTSVATVDSNGNVCGGIFDANHIVCSTKDANGNPLPDAAANITITSGSLKLVIPVAVHTNITSLQLSSTGVACTSQGGTQQFTASAFSNGVPVPAINTGKVTFSISDVTVATIDQNGLATAVKPGATNVNASVGNVNAVPIAVVTCPPASITLHESGNSNATFSLNPAGTIQYSPDVVDILGAPITGITLTPMNASPVTAKIDVNSLITAGTAGTTSVVLGCIPPTCNNSTAISTNGTTAGVPIYSNLVTGTVSGTSATTIYATGSTMADGTTANTSLIPIDTTANTAGTAITLPQSPNSMMFNPDGSAGYLGSANGLMIFNPGSGTVTTTITSVTGKVLAISPDGGRVIVSDTSKSTVFVFVASNSTVEAALTIPNATAAAWAPDNTKAYIVNSTSVFPYFTGVSRLTPLSIPASVITYLPQASVAFAGGTATSAIATCNNTQVNSQAVAETALAAARLGDHLIGANASKWNSFAVTASGSCPPVVTSNLNAVAISGASGTPNQVIVTPDSKFAFITGTTLAQGQASSGSVSGFDIGAGTAFAVALAGGGQPLAGAVTNDGKLVYVGVTAGTPAVHLIDASGATPSDTKQIITPFIPNIVVALPK